MITSELDVFLAGRKEHSRPTCVSVGGAMLPFSEKLAEDDAGSLCKDSSAVAPSMCGREFSLLELLTR